MYVLNLTESSFIDNVPCGLNYIGAEDNETKSCGRSGETPVKVTGGKFKSTLVVPRLARRRRVGQGSPSAVVGLPRSRLINGVPERSADGNEELCPEPVRTYGLEERDGVS